MSGKLTKRGSEAGAQTPPLLRASSPLNINRELTQRLEQRTGAHQWGSSIGTGRPRRKQKWRGPFIPRFFETWALHIFKLLGGAALQRCDKEANNSDGFSR